MAKFENGEVFSPLQKELIGVLEKNGPMTRQDLVKSCDSPRTTVYDNLMRLSNFNLIKKFSRPTNSRGRPLVFFKLQE
jgi:predicted transcriptional regulator